MVYDMFISFDGCDKEIAGHKKYDVKMGVRYEHGRRGVIHEA